MKLGYLTDDVTALPVPPVRFGEHRAMVLSVETAGPPLLCGDRLFRASHERQKCCRSVRTLANMVCSRVKVPFLLLDSQGWVRLPSLIQRWRTVLMAPADCFLPGSHVFHHSLIHS